MGKIVVTAFVTLDGVVQAPGFREEDMDGGFERGGWTGSYSDSVVTQKVTESVLAADALLLGRRSYQLLSSFWPTADPEDPRTVKLNSQPKFVISKTLTTADWHDTTILSGDPATEVARLKDEHGEISIWGSTQLITELLRHDLIDEFLLLVYPVVVGGGKRLFNGDTALGFDLVETTASGTGVAIHRYRRSAQ